LLSFGAQKFLFLFPTGYSQVSSTADPPHLQDNTIQFHLFAGELLWWLFWIMT